MTHLKNWVLLRCLWQGFRDLTSGTSLEKSVALACMFHRRTICITSFVLPLPGCCALQPAAPQGSSLKHEAAPRVRVTGEGEGWEGCEGESRFKQKCKALKGGTKKKQVGG